MDMQSLILVIVVAVLAAFLIGIVVARFTVRQAPSKVEQSAEEAAFASFERAIEMLADKTSEQQEVAGQATP